MSTTPGAAESASTNPRKRPATVALAVASGPDRKRTRIINPRKIVAQSRTPPVLEIKAGGDLQPAYTTTVTSGTTTTMSTTPSAAEMATTNPRKRPATVALPVAAWPDRKRTRFINPRTIVAQTTPPVPKLKTGELNVRTVVKSRNFEIGVLKVSM